VSGGSGEYEWEVSDPTKVGVSAKDGVALLHAKREGQTKMRIRDKNVCFNYKDVVVCHRSIFLVVSGGISAAQHALHVAGRRAESFSW
jgi:hypothetical protein